MASDAAKYDPFLAEGGKFTTDDIGTDTILATDIAAGAVGTSELADAAVTTVKIADGAVTDAKLNSASLVLKGEAAGDRVEYGRETFTNSGTAAADVTVTVTFATAFGAAPKAVVLGAETDLTTYISTAASTTGFSITVKSVPASTTVYVNWIAIGQ